MGNAAHTVGDLPGFLGRHLSPQTRFFEVRETLTLESGERLDGVRIAYRTWGDPANAADNAVLICHALTGSADADAWWPDIIGDGRASPARFHRLQQHSGQLLRHDRARLVSSRGNVTARPSRASPCGTWSRLNGTCWITWA